MLIELPLDKMTIKEKIQTMELIWNDLSKNEDSYVSPSWHENKLAERQERINKGIDQFEDWDQAKKNIRDKIS
jgi:hypothetical protein